ncbi:MAG: NAD(+) synthase [Solobacterium sp.]|nr:NAD(+) synthase [Solobacterium sp.]
MKNTMIKAGVCVPEMRPGDIEGNTDSIIRIMQENSGCGFLVFPELCVSGYTCADLFSQTLLLEKTIEALIRIRDASLGIKGMTAAVGAALAYGNDLYNCAVYISEGRICGIVPKVNIPNYSEFYEARWFTSGKDIYDCVIPIGDDDVPFGRDLLFEDAGSGAVIGTDICEDLWVPDKPSTHCALAGANIIANLSASDEVIGKHEFRTMMAAQQSAACWCAYLYASAGMNESSTDLVFSGHALIAQNGRVLKDDIFPDIPYVSTSLLDIEAIENNRRKQSTFNTEEDAFTRIPVSVCCAESDEISCSELSGLLAKEGYRISRNPFVPKDDEERGRRCRTILRIQAHGLATRVRSTGIKTLVIGISGGLDSTLALIVCSEARKIVPDIRVIAVTMPNRGNTTSLTYNNAVELMKILADEYREVPIEGGVQSHLQDIGHGGTYKGEGDTTYENAQARMRTYILMDIANMENGLVVGTGDLSELALGWCTYNGDHMSMYGVNGGVPKTLVRYICSSYALTCGNEDLKNVLLSIVDTPISPELTPNKDGQIAQKTEEKIGKYDLNDFFLYWHMRYGFSPQKVIAFAKYAYSELELSFIRDAAYRFYSRFFSQQFKRSCLPDGPKVGSVTLSPRGDWRMPSDASVKLWLDDVRKAQ